MVRPACRVKLVYAENQGRIVTIEGLDPIDPDRAIDPALALSSLVMGPQRFESALRGAPPEAAAPPPGFDLGIWEQMDLECRWVYHCQLLHDANLEVGKAWVQYLAQRGEFAMLEWIALYDRDRAFYKWQVGQALVDANAPGWLRLVDWCQGTSDGHSFGVINSLLQARPALALAWLNAHPEAKQRHKKVYDQLIENGHEPAESIVGFLPPFDVKTVYPRASAIVKAPRHALHAEPLLIDGESKTFEHDPKRLYVHQITREIDGLISQARHQALLPQLLQTLETHPVTELRLHALLAYTFRPPLVPMQRLLAMANDPNESESIREAAFLGFTYGDPSEAYLHCHHVALDIEPTLWRAALSRLGDIGDTATLKLLDEAWLERCPDPEFAKEALVRVENRVRNHRTTDLSSLAAHVMLAEQSADPLLEVLRVTLEELVAGETRRVGAKKLRTRVRSHPTSSAYVKDYLLELIANAERS